MVPLILILLLVILVAVIVLVLVTMSGVTAFGGPAWAAAAEHILL
jgi:preprotein translocase subunit SecG